MTTGELAGRADVNVQTVRYYERRGLLPEPPRTSSGYRQYREDDLKRLRFIRTAQELGFTLDEIAELLELRVAPDGRCEDVEARATRAIGRMEERMRELGRMREALRDLVEACRRAEPTEACPILASIEEES